MFSISLGVSPSAVACQGSMLVPLQPSSLQALAGVLGLSSYQQMFRLAKHTGLSGFAAESLAAI